jgi:hypothetical protein
LPGGKKAPFSLFRRRRVCYTFRTCIGESAPRLPGEDRRKKIAVQACDTLKLSPAAPVGRRKTMLRKKPVSLGLALILILLAFAGAGCSRNCPADGTWTTGDTEGLTSFEVKNCGIPFVYYTITVGGTPNSGRIGLLDTCRIDADQQFNCREQGYANPRWTFTGKFTSANSAEGQFIFNQGSEWDFGEIPENMVFDWKASLP